MNNRIVLVVIVVVLVLAIIGVGLVLFWKSPLFNGNTNTVTNANATGNINAIANTNAVTNTNTQANANAASNTNSAVNTAKPPYKAEIFSTKEIQKDVQYRGGVVPVESVVERSGFASIGLLPEDQKWVMVYLKKQKLTFASPMWTWVQNEITLLDGTKQNYSVEQSFFAEEQFADKDVSYLGFIVPRSASNFSLRFVRTGEDVSLDLGL